MKQCGLLGYNINYSKSPSIHNEYYRNKNVGLQYSIYDVSEHKLSNFIEQLRENNIAGFNVTIPYKEKIIKYLDNIETTADKIGAVNTVLVKEHTLEGYNTDYFGFVKSFEILDLNFKNSAALIIGAGGAAKAVYHGLKSLNCGSMIVGSRNVRKANQYFSKYCKVVHLDSINVLSGYDIIINCTPLGGINYLNEIPMELTTIKPGCIVYDLVYNPPRTKFLDQALLKGATIINGEGMLKYQAYEAADIWIDYLNKRK